VMYPLHAGVMSALGFLAAPVAFERMRAEVSLLDSIDLARANAILAELTEDARALVRAAGVPASECTVKREAALRFAGQSYALPVALPAGRLNRGHLATIRADFVAIYRRRYYRLNPDVPVELVHWRVAVTGPKPQLHIARMESESRNARKGTRAVYFGEAGRYVDCAVYDRFALSTGKRLRGPAVIEEPESTVVIGPGSSAVIDRDGNLMASLANRGRRARPTTARGRIAA